MSDKRRPPGFDGAAAVTRSLLGYGVVAGYGVGVGYGIGVGGGYGCAGTE